MPRLHVEAEIPCGHLDAFEQMLNEFVARVSNGGDVRFEIIRDIPATLEELVNHYKGRGS